MYNGMRKRGILTLWVLKGQELNTRENLASVGAPL